MSYNEMNVKTFFVGLLDDFVTEGAINTAYETLTASAKVKRSSDALEIYSPVACVVVEYSYALDRLA